MTRKSNPSQLPPDGYARWRSLSIPLWKGGLLLGLSVLTILICFLTRPADTTPIAGVKMELPGNFLLQGLIGQDMEVSKAEKKILPPDTEFARRNYLIMQDNRMTDQSMFCSIVLAGSQDRSIHRPERCMPAQGWTINKTTPITVEMPNGKVLHAQCLDLSMEKQDAEGKPITIRSLYIYWFVGDNFTTNSNLTRMVRSIYDRIFLNRQHRWAYVIVGAPITESTQSGFRLDREQTLTMLKQFMKIIVPEFQKSFMESGAEELDAEVDISEPVE